MSTPALATEAAAAGRYPGRHFDRRERKLLLSVKTYVDAQTPADGSVTTAKLAAGAVTLAKLATGITPSHVVKFAGKYTTLGGSATEAQTLAGVASTDIVIATLQTKGATPRTILTTAPTTNTLTYVFSGDPSTDHVVSYMVLRAAS